VYCSTRAYLFVNLLSSLNWPWFCSDAWQDFWRIFNRPWFPSLLWFRFVLPNMTSAFCFVFPPFNFYFAGTVWMSSRFSSHTILVRGLHDC
jgi:hypothetical protein